MTSNSEKLRRIAGRYMQLKKEKEELDASLKEDSELKEADEHPIEDHIEVCMSNVLEHHDESNIDIAGISPVYKTKSHGNEALFESFKAPVSLSTDGDNKNIKDFIKEGRGLRDAVKTWHRSQRKSQITDGTNTKHTTQEPGDKQSEPPGQDTLAVSAKPQNDVPVVLAGLRVVRGPDWNFGDVDGGEGHVGTLRPIREKEGYVTVLWDNGESGTYRTEDASDLLVLDPGPAGIKHPGFCYECAINLHGFRWKCIDCVDHHVCTNCYGAEKHDLTHKFDRYDSISSRTLVGSRNIVDRQQSRGCFPEATVRKNDDIEWRFMPEKLKAKHGTVLHHSYRQVVDGLMSVIEVSWMENRGPIRVMHSYGWRGRFELITTKAADGPWYYKSHLPRLSDHLQHLMRINLFQTSQNMIDFPVLEGQLQKLVEDIIAPATELSLATRLKFNEGDIVRCVETVEFQQRSVADWAVSHLGCVYAIDTRGNVVVDFGKFVTIFPPRSLKKESLTIKKEKANKGNKLDNLFRPGDLVCGCDEQQVDHIGVVIEFKPDRLEAEVTFGALNVGAIPIGNLIPQAICLREVERDIQQWKPDMHKFDGSTDQYLIGDVVNVLEEREEVQRLQDNQHGGWSSHMLDYLGKSGLVCEIWNESTVVVSFGDKNLFLHPAAVTKMEVFIDDKGRRDGAASAGTSPRLYIGEFVRVDPSRMKVEKDQKDHGGWRETMTKIVGKVGIIQYIEDDKYQDVHVLFGLYRYCLNQSVLTRVKPKSAAKAPSGKFASTKPKKKQVREIIPKMKYSKEDLAYLKKFPRKSPKELGILIQDSFELPQHETSRYTKPVQETTPHDLSMAPSPSPSLLSSQQTTSTQEYYTKILDVFGKMMEGTPPESRGDLKSMMATMLNPQMAHQPMFEMRKVHTEDQNIPSTVPCD